MWYSVHTAEGATVSRVVTHAVAAYAMPVPVAAPPAAARRATSRSLFTGYDATGQRYELCPAWYEQVWQHARALVPTGWQPPRSVEQCKAFIIALFGQNILTPSYAGFRKPNTTRRAGPRKRRSSSEGTADDPDGYWDVEISRTPKRSRAPHSRAAHGDTETPCSSSGRR